MNSDQTSLMIVFNYQGVQKGTSFGFLQQVFGPGWSTNQLYKNPNIA